MALESSAALWLGLSVPVVLALWLLRPRRPRVRVPSLLLWPASPAERHAARPWQRLKNHPLLWLQVLAALLLVAAAARPFIPAAGSGQHLVVLLDASGSMRAHDVAPDRFAAARSAVLDIARGLGPNQDLSLIRLDEQPRILATRVTSAAELEPILANQTAGYGAANMPAAFSLAAGAVQGASEWVLVTDGGLDLPPNASLPSGTSFRLLRVGSEQAGNVALRGLAVRQTGETLSVQAAIENLSRQGAQGTVELHGEGHVPHGARAWQADAGGAAYVTWTHVPMGAAWFEARLRADAGGSANSLAHDDRAWVGVPVRTSDQRVLLVSGGNPFLERALEVHGGLRAYRAAPSDWLDIAGQGTPYPLTIFDRHWPANPPSGNSLIIGPPTGDSFRPLQVWPRSDHLLMRHVDWSDVRIGAARTLALGGDWETIIDSDGGPLLSTRATAGQRQAVLAFELGQSDLPLRTAFPVLMSNLLEWLLPSASAEPLIVEPGGSVAPVSTPLADAAWVESADGVRVAELAPPWPARPFSPPAPGFYRLVQTGEQTHHTQLVFAAAYVEGESDVTARDLQLTAADGSPADAARGALAFWPWLATAILALSLLEWWVDARGR